MVEWGGYWLDVGWYEDLYMKRDEVRGKRGMWVRGGRKRYVWARESGIIG